MTGSQYASPFPAATPLSLEGRSAASSVFGSRSNEPVALPDTMQALCCTPTGPELCAIPRPTPGADELLLRVELAGICRTDREVAQGLWGEQHWRVLGHELCGHVVAGEGLAPGTMVVVNPIIPCGTCPACLAQESQRCASPSMLGVDRNGAFAEYLCVPRRAAYAVPDHFDPRRLAYVEPVAASRGLLLDELPERIGLVGSGRIASLSRRLLAQRGIALDCVEERPDGSWPWTLELTGTSEGLSRAIAATQAGGVILLKARRVLPTTVDLLPVVRRELRLRGIHYGDFAEAVDAVLSDELQLDDLFGPVYPLEQWREAFAADEAEKIFLRPGAAPCAV